MDCSNETMQMHRAEDVQAWARSHWKEKPTRWGGGRSSIKKDGHDNFKKKSKNDAENE